MGLLAKLLSTARDLDAAVTSDITQISDGVYQGGVVPTIPSYIDAAINLHTEPLPAAAHLKAALHLPILDGPPFPGIAWLETAVGFVALCRQAGWSVLIRCAAGQSRSGMVSTAFHMHANGWTRDVALAYVQGKRPQTRPHVDYLRGLLEYEQHLSRSCP